MDFWGSIETAMRRFGIISPIWQYEHGKLNMGFKGVAHANYKK